MQQPFFHDSQFSSQQDICDFDKLNLGFKIGSILNKEFPE